MPSTPGSYLETEILTAPPQKLQLMMIDAAIRFAQRANEHWKADQEDLACESLVRSQQIVTELINGLNREESPELVGKIASVYVFIFRRLMEASLERNETKLLEAVRVLQEERETWRQVCEKVGTTQTEVESTLVMPPVSMTPPTQTPLSTTLPDAGLDQPAPGGFSIDA
ncbi:MAG: flagellar export chaperone FliS [Pirellulales bacterium]|nr:flagellar export chaperone FliS [Pirellulales bacterium]